MEVKLKKVTVRELTKDYQDNLENGITGYAGKLDIRPPYQREFVYNNKQREAVIDTVSKGFPLNIMYWAVRDDETFEIIDGQQRTISLCQYVNGDFAFRNKNGDDMYFDNLWDDEQKEVLDYELDVYVCKGTTQDKLDWFHTINIAGEELTDQELRNAVYHGPWVTDSKKYFSKTGCPAYQIGNQYLKGTAIRQDYFETVLKWVSKGNIESYMAKHQHDENAEPLWDYFVGLIDWIETVFINYEKEMKGLPWGPMYEDYKDLPDSEDFDSEAIAERVKELMGDEDVTKKKGVYQYILDGNERHLSIRTFNNREKREAYEAQNGICPYCEKEFDIKKMHADHITPWSKGGKTVPANLQMLCRDCNLKKSDS